MPDLATPYDPTAALERMLARLRADTGATRVAVLVHEASTGVVMPFRHAVADTPDGRSVPVLHAPVTVSRSPFLSAVIRDRRSVQARADGRRGPDREMADRGIRSAHGEPLIRDGEVVGVLTVEPAAAAAPHLLRRLTPRLAAAMTEGWARHSSARRLAQAEILVGIIEAASTARSTDHLLATACRRLAELGEVDRACIFLLEDGRPVPRMAAYADGRRDATTWERFRNAPVESGVVEMVLRTGQPVAADRDSGLLADWWVEHFEIASLLAVPLGRAPDIAGVLTLDSTRLRPFPDDVRRLAAAAGAHLGGVIEQARLRAVEQQRLEQLADEAHRDPLTGLPNRRRFIEQLEATVYGDGARPCAVFMIDLDRFKEINDSFGHGVGDELLCQVGPRLRTALREDDLLARMGGDEFAVLLPDADHARARDVAAELTATLREAFLLDAMPLHVDASIGIAVSPDHGRDRSLLLARADTAMYTAKRARHGVEVWTPDRSPDSRDRLETLEQLRTALDGDELDNHYQPKLDLSTGSVVGVEALVRWNHPTRDRLSPDVFLPLAEQAGLMRRLSLGVFERALRDLQTWRSTGHDLSMAVNLSVSNLQDIALAEQVEMLLDSFGVPGEALVLEITEDVVMADTARSAQVMAALRRLGVRLAIDDYGTGYASLSYLRALPVDELTLDRSFARHLATDERDAAIVRSTVQLSRDLGMTLVVEGVEDATTLSLLRGWGCDQAQGYHIARPMPAEELLTWLDAHPAGATGGDRPRVPRPRTARERTSGPAR